MRKLSNKLYALNTGYGHWCPGCGHMHKIPDTWEYDGNPEAPTFAPSVRHRFTLRKFSNGRWNGEWHRDENGRTVRGCCHYFVKDGKIEFCPDSTHRLSGKTVDLPDIPLGYEAEY